MPFEIIRNDITKLRDDAVTKGSSRFPQVAQYIEQHYIEPCEKALFRAEAAPRLRLERTRNRPEAAAPMARPCAAPTPKDLDGFLKQKDAGFMETLLELIAKRGQKNSAIYKKANISKQHFSKLVNDPKAAVTKPVAVALALALELDLVQTKDLIGRAGYTLTNSSVFDLIIQYHIENRIFDVVQINMVLYEFDQPLLGSG